MGEKKVIESDLLKVQDPDSTSDQLIFNIIESDAGHIESVSKDGEIITSFTQEELDRNMIMYVHHPNTTNDSFISLQVSDGIATSPIAKIRVSVSPQYWRLQNNTGLIVLHQSFSVISSTNLSFISNVNGVDYKIQFFITKPPIYGVVEIEKSVNNWVTTVKFTNNDLKQFRVRYRHTNGKPEFDEFLFRISVDKSAVYTFRLIFAKCSLRSTASKELITLDSDTEVVLQQRYLFHETQPMRVQPTSILYVVAKTPIYGLLFSAVSKYTLKTCDRFTQEDIISENIKYKFLRKPYSFVNETIDFHVLSPGCNDSKASVHILYHPPVSSHVTYHSRTLRIDEGSTGVIDDSHLNIKTPITETLLFNITLGPRNGFLKVLDGDLLIRNNTSFFTLKELNSNKLLYEHNGDENEKDFFEFVAMSNVESDFLFVGNFTITIALKNDNSPVRRIDKVFHVVVGGERLLTSDDLEYTDADIDTKPSQIVYTWRDLLNGDFHRADNQTLKIDRFTQQDLDKKVVLFRHKGAEYAKVRMWVSDGEFHTNGVLEIQASAPFIHVNYDKKLVVEQGSSAVVTNEHLSHSTNVFAIDSDVKYQITKHPSHGKLIFAATGKPANHFNQNDIKSGSISYVNTSPNANADVIEFRVKCKDAVNIAQLGIWLFPHNYWKPFKTSIVDGMIVEESTSAVINRSVLEVSQVNVPSSSITFHIVQPPDYGYISILPTNSLEYEPIDVSSFTQEMVNDNKVLYIQSVANKSKDVVYFNITNGIIWQNGVVLNIKIIPEQIYVTSTNLSVAEGGVAVLTPAHISITTDYYKDKIKEYQILQNPKYGCIQVHKKCLKGYSFTQKELTAGVVKYKHDDSENLVDSVKLAATAQNKQSLPVTLFINVQQVNDLGPTLNVSESLEMWQGGVATITNDTLSAIDDDSPAEKLIYQVYNSVGGKIFVRSDTMTVPVQQFTQKLIDNNMVFYKHENGSEGAIYFYVTDGKYTTGNHTLLIKTKQVYLNLQKKSLRVFPLQRKYINSSHLLATTSDPARIITYEVVLPPSLGRLMIEPEMGEGGLYRVVTTFTQNNLNENRIFYEHTHPFSDLYANDSFVFNVRAPFAPHLRNEILNIDISVSSGGLDAYVVVPKVSVDEGGVTAISLNLSGVVTFLENHAGLRSPIIHGVCSAPQHGQVFLQHNPNVTTFTQQQMESGMINYEHDHSETLFDNINFSLYLLPGYVLLSNVTVPITINPINDQPFRLVTSVPTLEVVHGENHTITREELLTEDDDTPPSKIKYDVISGPNEGKLILLPGAVPVTYFTQADVDNNCLIYVHNSSTLKDSFHFRVWDEKFRPQFTLFNIIVLPIFINVSRGLPLILQQGSDVVFLSEKQINIETNVQLSKIRYKVIEGPNHGVLYVKDGPSIRFTQTDLQHDSVMYLQTDMTTANDSFKIVAETTGGQTVTSSNEITVSVKVQPYIAIRNFTVVASKYNKVTLNVLDATPLAKLTNSNPRYTVISLPQYSHVHKVIRSSGEKKNALDNVVVVFTHEEIKSGLIYLVVDDAVLPWNGIQSKLTFLIAASIFQPAVGEMLVNIQTSLDNDIQSTLAGPSDPAGHEGGLHLASPNMTRDYFLILSMVAGVVILGVAVIVIIKYRSFQVDEMNKEACLQPRPLPRPPETLLAPSPLSVDGSPMSMTLPQCKVTPLSGNELESYACYPYGNGSDEQHSEEWSCCEASDQASNTKNVMLRRNQYWV